MKNASCLHVITILFIVIFLFTYSWHPLSKLDFFVCSQSTSWCTSKNRIYAKLASVLDTQIHKPKDHLTEIPHHPLDPLTIQEINKVRTILSSYEPFLSPFPAVHSLSLDEPDKNRVLGWKEGDPLPPRRALVIALLNGQSHVLSVDLELGRVITHEIYSGSGYPMVSMDDVVSALQVALSNEELNKSATIRGVSFSDLSCITPSAGWYGANEEGKRVIKVQCFSSQDTANYFMRPIEGLTLTVDLDKKEVMKFLIRAVAFQFQKQPTLITDTRPKTSH